MLEPKKWVVNPITFKVQSVEAYRNSTTYSRWVEDYVIEHLTKDEATAFRSRLLRTELEKAKKELSLIELAISPNAATTVEKVGVYENLLHMIQINAEVVMNSKRMKELISNICSWSYAHRAGNGEFTQNEQDKMIYKAFKNLFKEDK